MERLTEFWGGIWGMSKQAIEDGYDKYSVFSKLAAYEDAGLTPQEIEDIKTILDVDGDGKSGEDTLKDLLELMQYRKTGLTPEEITELERKYLNDEHEYCGEYGTDECQFAYRIDKLQQECDFWEREAKKNCSKLGEQRIKLQQVDCEGIAKDKNGKCLGYCYSETDDEPIEKCKNCELYESYEDI